VQAHVARLQLVECVRDGFLRVRVKPNASKTEILELKDGVVHIAIKAPADKNKANAELVRFLSKELGRPCRIKRGLTSRDKVIVC
jgi:uncharacterized protein (TIGR00251 family)